MNGPATPRSARTAQSQREETDDASGGPKTTRNWQELMQELRVTQTGVQILTGFLLTVPFSQRFTQLNHHQRTAYFVVLVSCVLQTVFLVAPVAFHRVLFHQRQRPWLVAAGHVCALCGLALMAVTSCGVVYLVLDFTTHATVAVTVTAGLAAAFAVLWLGVPLIDLVRRPDSRDS